MPKNWQGNVSLQLGTGFWLFLTVLVLGFIAWRFGWFREGRLANMLSYSISGNRDLIYSKN